MADALVELIQVLNSKNGQERMTKQEADVFGGCKSQAIRGFALGGSIATSLVWVASRKLNSFLRINLAGGAGFITGMWRFQESIDSCVNHILAMDGSRLQHELRKIVLQKYHNDPQRMKAFSKHFYSEEVLNDSTPHLKSVYRQRSTYMDDQLMTSGKTIDDSEAIKKGEYHQQRNDDLGSLNLKRPGMEIRPAHVNPGVDVIGYGDPLDVLFGYSSANEEFRQRDDSSASARVESRSQRRVQRRNRMRHHRREGSLSARGIA